MAISVQRNEGRPKGDKSLFPLEGVLHKLQSFEIPDFQREYVWDKNKVDLFFNDFYYMENSVNNRFMGVILYESEEDKKPKLLDGQQRVITSILSFAAAVQSVDSSFRSRLYSLVGGFMKSQPNNDSVYTMDIEFNNCGSNAENVIKILSNEPDEWKETGIISNNEVKSIKRMKENYLFFFDKYNTVIKDPEKICDFVERVFNNSDYLMIKTDNLDEAFTLFESLNYRGVSLRSFELINNFYLHCYTSEDKREKHRNEWDAIKKNLDASGGEGLFDKILELFWYCYKENSENDGSKPRDWYVPYVDLIQKNRKYLQMVKSMRTVSEIIRSLCDESYDFTKSKFISKDGVEKTSIKKHVHMFRILGYPSIVLPLYVASLMYSKEYEKMNELFNAIESYCIRNVWIVGGESKSTSINNMNGLARGFVKDDEVNEEKKINKLIDELNKIIVPDTQFKDEFLRFEPKIGRDNSSDSRKIKLIFSRIFDIEELSTMSTNFSTYSVEHICSVKDKNERFIEESCRNRFGNLTVMSSSTNNGTEPYYNKLPVYQNNPVLCAKCLENICSSYSSGDRSVLDHKVLSKITADELCKVEEGTYWSQDEDDYINGKSRYSIWSEYLCDQFIKHWPKKETGEESKDGEYGLDVDN